MFDAQLRRAYPDLSENEYEKHKDKDFANWLKFYVNNGYGNQPTPLWFHELVQGPTSKIVTAPMYFTRGYAFHDYKHGSRRASANYGVHVRGDTDFYGVINEILEVSYAGQLNLKVVLFNCDWYDPTLGRGVRVNNLGVRDVNANRRYTKFEPYVLASQAEQVTFIPYPRIRARRTDVWLSVIHVSPRGRFVGVEEDIVLQEALAADDTIDPIESTDYVVHVDPVTRVLEVAEETDHEVDLAESDNEAEEETDVDSLDDSDGEADYISDN